jgi:ribonucleoside-diphosphate reductase beta chain
MSLVFDAQTPLELYRRWEQEHWSAQAVDFARDRRDWLELTDKERWQWYWLAGFSHFRQSETHIIVFLATLLSCLPRPEQQQFLSTQIADEGRHAYFFERFHKEVLSTAAPTNDQRQLEVSSPYQSLFITSSTELVHRAADERSPQTLATAAVHIFLVLEGSIALASLHVIRQLIDKIGRFPGLLEGLTCIHRDEVRHAQFGITLLQDILATQPSCRDAVVAHIEDILPTFSEVLTPGSERKTKLESLGLNPYERRQRAFALLQRNLRSVGIDGKTTEAWITRP